MQPHPPGPGVRQPSDSAHTQDIARTLASLKSKFPAAVIWSGRATGRWWAMAGAGRRAQLLEAESPSALTAALVLSATLSAYDSATVNDAETACDDAAGQCGPSLV
jgi:hypothetical protein